MSNRMAEVADLLGIKLGEVFFIKEQPGCFKTYLKFTENGLMELADKNSWRKAAAWMWEQLITGALKVNKLPWKPKMNEEYYVPYIHCAESSMCSVFPWHGDKVDNKLYQLGLVCKTREEAIVMTKKMIAGLEKKQ